MPLKLKIKNECSNCLNDSLNGAVKVFADNVKRFQTTSGGVQILDNGAGSQAVLELGTTSTTEQGFLRLNGSTVLQVFKYSNHQLGNLPVMTLRYMIMVFI